MLKESACSFRAADTVSEERSPYTELNPIMELNETNGVTVGPVHRSHHPCAQIVQHIAKDIKSKCISTVRSLDSISADENTIHGRPHVILDVRCDVTGNGDVDNVVLLLLFKSLFNFSNNFNSNTNEEKYKKRSIFFFSFF